MLKPGDLVGPYEIRGFVGQGGMGQVYRAFDPRLERTVALKVIVVPEQAPPDDSTRLSVASEFSARLLREARAVASLSHPNVVGIFDVGESAGRLYLAMEYVVGSTLRQLASDRDVPLSRRLRWMVEVARALEVAHRAGLVHRDDKPENVMIREDGSVKVLDFGIARRAAPASASGDGDPHAEDTVTGGGAIAGTPFYMAPEQIKGTSVDARCDQFAWGVTAYELLCGTRPWSDTADVLQLVAKVMTEPAPPLRARAKDIPAAVEETILRTLSKDPAARYPTMADVADALEPHATHGPTQSSTHVGGDRVRITPRTFETPEDQTAYAATTRVPTSVAVLPEATASREREETAASTSGKPRPRGTLSQLAVPLVLIAVLVAAVSYFQLRAGRTPLPINATRPLSTVPEAEREFKEAMAVWRDGAAAKARAGLARAVELDPTFAAAHLELALQTAQDDPAAAQASFQNAFEHRQMLLPRDNELLRASEPYVRPQPDLDEWETRLTTAVFQFPRDAELQLLLGRAREKQGADEDAKAAYEAAVRLDSGFVPAIAALANAERNLDNVREAIAATERCTKLSPVATTCIETRYRVFSETGECHRAREEAAAWRALEPQSPHAANAFARALHADGAPRPSVEEALTRAWSLHPPDKKERSEIWDRTNLALIDGDLARAEKLARDYDAALPPQADRSDHAHPARIRIHVLYESDRIKDAAKAAHDYLDRMDAWAPYPFASDPSITFYEPLFRNGELTRAELAEHRTRWIEREKQRTPGGDHDARGAWNIWTVWGGFAETREEAAEALGHLPQGVALPVGMRRTTALDFTIGKVYALVGRPDEAIPALLRVTGSCAAFEDALLVLRARYYLGVAYEANGEKALAKAAYERVVATWPKGNPSRTVKWSERRLEALSK